MPEARPPERRGLARYLKEVWPWLRQRAWPWLRQDACPWLRQRVWPRLRQEVWPWLRLWGWGRGWLVLIPLVIIAGVIRSPLLEVPPVTATEPHTLYLLSALAQSLAAVLALVFTISLIVAQLASRYSHRMLAAFFGPWTKAYILLFIAAVLLPFWLLARPDPPWVKLSLLLATACLLLLIPYFLSFRDQLSPEKRVEDLKARATQQLKGASGAEPGEISTMDNFVMSAFVLKDYDTLSKGVEALADLALGAYERRNDDVGRGVLGRLRDIGLATIEDPRAPLRVLENLGRVGAKAAEKGLEDAAWLAAFSLGPVGAKAAEKGLEDAALLAASWLGQVGAKAAEKGLEPAAVQAAFSLGRVGAKAAEKGLADATERAAYSLGRVGAKAAEKGVELAARGAASCLGEVGAKAAEKGLELAAGQAAFSLGEVAVKAAEKHLGDAAGLAASWLWVLGAWARFKNNPGLEQSVIPKLKAVKELTGELVPSAYEPGFIIPYELARNLLSGRSNLLEALEEFRKFYEASQQ